MRIQAEHCAALDAEEEALAREPDVPLECARAVSYLRTRARWTPETEERLIRSYKDPSLTPAPPEDVLSGDWR